MDIEKLKINKSQNKTKLLIMIAGILFLFIVSMCVGNYNINLLDTLPELLAFLFGNVEKLSTGANVILNIRLPRTLSAILVGASLSVSGITFQSLFCNKLASPDLLGVSTGSCVGASICILLEMNALQIQFGAFFSGLLSVTITYAISKMFKQEKRFSLILSGILVGGIMTSLLGLIKYLANPETQLPSIVYWTMGDISKISLKQLSYVIFPMIISIVILCLISWRLNFFAINEDVAKSMGIDINVLKLICIILATLLTASSVSIAGTINWVGLAMPQAVRLFIGDNTKYSIKFSILAGMMFLLIADIFGRIISTAEIPMSVLTGVPGVIIFIFCIYLSNREVQNETHSK